MFGGERKLARVELKHVGGSFWHAWPTWSDPVRRVPDSLLDDRWWPIVLEIDAPDEKTARRKALRKAHAIEKSLADDPEWYASDV
jgi:hypothetical protein